MTGWTAVQRGVDVNYDLENSPLQIRTDSLVGSNEEVELNFFTAEGLYLGGVGLYFESSPLYRLFLCGSSRTNFPTSFPTETDKIWTIALIKTSGGVRIIMHCNNKEVLNFVFSDTTCSSDSNWSERWGRDVEKIYFSNYDTASDYYRPGKLNTCKW